MASKSNRRMDIEKASNNFDNVPLSSFVDKTFINKSLPFHEIHLVEVPP